MSASSAFLSMKTAPRSGIDCRKWYRRRRSELENHGGFRHPIGNHGQSASLRLPGAPCETRQIMVRNNRPGTHRVPQPIRVTVRLDGHMTAGTGVSADPSFSVPSPSLTQYAYRLPTAESTDPSKRSLQNLLHRSGGIGMTAKVPIIARAAVRRETCSQPRKGLAQRTSGFFRSVIS